MKIKWKNIREYEFFIGWKLIIICSILPILVSIIYDLVLNISLHNLQVNKSILFDPSYITNYLIAAFLHILLCIIITLIVYKLYKSNKSIFIGQFYINHLISFIGVSLFFSLFIYLFDSTLKKLSFNLLMMSIDNRLSIGINFFWIPFSLVIFAFLPASAIMLSIHSFIQNITNISDLEFEQKILVIQKKFELLFLLISLIFISSSIATIFYFKTPASFIELNSEKNKIYLNLLESITNIWLIIYFCILSITFTTAISHYMKTFKKMSTDDLSQFEFSPGKEATIFFEYYNILKLVLGSFSPIIVLLISKLF